MKYVSDMLRAPLQTRTLPPYPLAPEISQERRVPALATDFIPSFPPPLNMLTKTKDSAYPQGRRPRDLAFYCAPPRLDKDMESRPPPSTPDQLSRFNRLSARETTRVAKKGCPFCRSAVPAAWIPVFVLRQKCWTRHGLNRGLCAGTHVWCWGFDRAEIEGVR
ncbi:hypothetical protein CC78DRAFT_535592 [Lojkania enalia]|uniref:Uncharacterized protein n=1 Tax=Lojkania enalia TaxID=147567 RepID=A0A9P4N0L5_9PLEO|nr:hypothetical protein CC78DRAFT_535592 [Didymosphaeria enalia]